MRPPINNPTSAPDVTELTEDVAGGSHQRMVRDRCECTVGTGQGCPQEATHTVHPRDGTRTYKVCETHGDSATNNGWDVRPIPNDRTHRPPE